MRGFSTLGCPKLGLAEVFSLAKKHGMGAVELRALNGTIDLPAALSDSFATPEELARFVESSGVQIPMVGTSFALAGGAATQREQLLAIAPWAEAIGARWLRVFDGVPAEGAEAARTEAVTWWRALRRARGWNLDIAVETHDALLTGEVIERFAERTGTAVLWDAHHTWKEGGEEPLSTWSQIRKYVVHLHVKDSVNVAGPAGGFRYVPPGTGEFPMAGLRARLAGEFSGCVSLEWERFWQPQLGPLDEALRAAKSHSWW